MIALAPDCLFFQMQNGESLPLSAEMLSFDLMGNTSQYFDAEFVRHASHAVIHYFRHDLGRNTVTMGEFAAALEKVLRGFVLCRKGQESGSNANEDQPSSPPEGHPEAARYFESDLSRLACESGKGCELFFFPRLRDQVRHQLGQGPTMLRFRELRRCVKQLAGAQRWSPRCQCLKEQIVTFLRDCLSTQRSDGQVAMVIV